MFTSDNRPWPTTNAPAARIVGGLFRSRNYVWDNDHRVVAAHGLTWTQFLTLSALRSAVPDHTLSPTQLYEATQASSGGITKMLHALSAAGYVERIDNPEDKRSTLVRITVSGAELVERVVEELIQVNTDLFGSILSEDECQQLAGLLRKLSTGLQQRKSGA